MTVSSNGERIALGESHEIGMRDLNGCPYATRVQLLVGDQVIDGASDIDSRLAASLRVYKSFTVPLLSAQNKRQAEALPYVVRLMLSVTA